MVGKVTALGWSERHLVAKRLAGGTRERSGWVVLELQTGEMQGPLTDSEFEKARDHDAGLRAVNVLSMGDAWKELSGR